MQKDLNDALSIGTVDDEELATVVGSSFPQARVFPVNYLLDGGGIVFRTDEGTKLDAARAGAVGTFEVDDSDPLYHTGWSVMAHRIPDAPF